MQNIGIVVTAEKARVTYTPCTKETGQFHILAERKDPETGEWKEVARTRQPLDRVLPHILKGIGIVTLEAAKKILAGEAPSPLEFEPDAGPVTVNPTVN